jgi:hypothetical protein
MVYLDSFSPLGGVAEPSCHRQPSVTKSPERILVLPVLECRLTMKTLNFKFAHFLVWMAFSLLGSIAFIVGLVVLIDHYVARIRQAVNRLSGALPSGRKGRSRVEHTMSRIA